MLVGGMASCAVAAMRLAATRDVAAPSTEPGVGFSGAGRGVAPRVAPAVAAELGGDGGVAGSLEQGEIGGGVSDLGVELANKSSCPCCAFVSHGSSASSVVRSADIHDPGLAGTMTTTSVAPSVNGPRRTSTIEGNRALSFPT